MSKLDDNIKIDHKDVRLEDVNCIMICLVHWRDYVNTIMVSRVSRKARNDLISRLTLSLRLRTVVAETISLFYFV